jgi:hypothetical protein
MVKLPTKQIFGVPSLETTSQIDDVDSVTRAQAVHYRLQARMHELESQFESKASELRAAFVAEMAEIFSTGE